MSDVVVVGAGLAGLAAARRLVALGHEVAVVEARERVGGRTEGLVLDDGTPLELGGHWLGEGHTRMYELVGELGLSSFRTWNDEGQLLLELQGKRSMMKPHKGAVPRISPFALADLTQGLLRFARLAARTDLERPWLTPGAEVLDGQTWESWIRRNLRTKAGRAYFHVACEAVWAADAIPGLDDGHRVPERHEPPGGGQSGQPGADHDDVAHPLSLARCLGLLVRLVLACMRQSRSSAVRYAPNKAWMPRSCCSSDVDVASMSYPRSQSRRRDRTTRHENAAGTQKHQGQQPGGAPSAHDRQKLRAHRAHTT